MLLLASLPAWALDPARPFRQYAHERWSVNEGLPFPGGYALAQDGEGYLWLGSLSGLARFDGTRIQTFDRSNVPELGGNQIFGLESDRRGRLWIGTERGAVLYDRGTFTAMPGLQGRAVRALGLDGQGRMLLSDSEAVYALDESLQVRRKFHLLRVHAMGRHGDQLWFAADNVLHRLDGEDFTRFELPGLGQGFVDGFASSGGRFWARSTSGLYEFDGRGWRMHADPRLQQRVISLLVDRDGNLWAGLERVLLRLRGGQVVEEADIGRIAPSPRRLFEDRDGSLWVATNSAGLHRFWNGVADFAPMSEPPSGANYLWALAAWQGRVIAAGSHGLSERIDGKIVGIAGENELPLAYSLFPERDVLWIGTVRGVYQYHADGSLRSPPELAALDNTRSNAFMRDRDGRLWVGTSRGLYRLDGDGSLKRITGDDDSSRWEARAIRQMRDGRIFVAGDNGVWQIAQDRPHAVRVPEQDMIVMALHELSDGRLLIGSKTSGMLYLQHGSGWLPLGVDRGVPSNEVQAIIADDRGHLLVSGLRGAYLVQERQLLQMGPQPEALLDVTGLLTLNRKYAPGQEVLCCLGGGDGRGAYLDGRFYLPTPHGVYSLAVPGRAQAMSLPRVEKLVTPRRSYTGNGLRHAGGLSLAADERDLQLDFSVISLSPMHTPRLDYRLHGYDKTWRALSPLAQPRVQYTNLPPGEYRFEVRDASLPEDARTAVLSLRIAPTLLETWWFRALVGMFGACVLLALARMREWRLLKQRARLEQEVASQTSQLRQAYARLETISRTDALTGLHNRGYASGEVAARLKRLSVKRSRTAEGEGRQVLFVLLDIDHFKAINDTHGHHAGDQVLQEVATRLSQQVRAGDGLARWGGEEFLLVYFDLDASECAPLGERICECVRRAPMVVDGKRIEVTASLGLARVAHAEHELLGADWERLLRAADAALYQAKRDGRNRWVLVEVSGSAGNVLAVDASGQCGDGPADA